MDPTTAATWVDVGAYDELHRRRKVVVRHGDEEILVLVHDGEPYAFVNHCIHRQRELARGVVLHGRLVCPGHQWAFELGTGWESTKGECQPTFEAKVSAGRVLLDVASRRLRGQAPADG